MPEEQSDDDSKERGREIIENMAAQQRAMDEAARPKGDGSLSESESGSDKDFMQVLRENEDLSDVMTAEEMAEEISDE